MNIWFSNFVSFILGQNTVDWLKQSDLEIQSFLSGNLLKTCNFNKLSLRIFFYYESTGWYQSNLTFNLSQILMCPVDCNTFSVVENGNTDDLFSFKQNWRHLSIAWFNIYSILSVKSLAKISNQLRGWVMKDYLS